MTATTETPSVDLILSAFSHEVRTPLTAMSGALNLLAEGTLGPVPAEQKGFIDLALRNARRLESLIAAILESGRAAAGEWPVDPIPSRLERLVQAGIDEALDTGGPARAPVTLTADPGLGLVPADAEGVRRVVKNLVANALRFTDPAGAVTVRLAAAADGAVVEVTDTGPGVAPEHRERIFERFRQLPAARGGRPHGGLGLGLFLARRIAEAHGGTLCCVDPPGGRGACFRLALPGVAPRRLPSSPLRVLRVVRADGAPLRAGDTFRAAEALRSTVPSARRWEHTEAVVAVLPDAPPDELAQARARVAAALDGELCVKGGAAA